MAAWGSLFTTMAQTALKMPLLLALMAMQLGIGWRAEVSDPPLSQQDRLPDSGPYSENMGKLFGFRWAVGRV